MRCRSIRAPAQIVAAVKRWETPTTTEAVLYLPDRIVRLRANQTGATTHGFSVVEEIANPLGVGAGRRHPQLRSDSRRCAALVEIDDLMPLVDALNKSLADMMVTSEYVGRPRRWATGIELVEEPVLDDDGNPVLDDDGKPVVDGGQSDPRGFAGDDLGERRREVRAAAAADLAGYEAIGPGASSARSWLSQRFPRTTSECSPTTRPSADALRAAEASLTARAEATTSDVRPSWEQVARLMIAVRDGRDPQRSMSGWHGPTPRHDRWPRRPTPSRSCSPPAYCRRRTRWEARLLR